MNPFVPHRRTVLALTALFALAGVILAATQASARKPKTTPKNAQAIAVTARPAPLDIHARDQTRFGKLDWLGTVELTSPSPWFGGYSALAIDRTGTHFMALSDAGSWLKGSIVYRVGRIDKLTGVVIGPLKGRDGKILSGGRNADAEALAFVQPGTLAGSAYVAFEQRHRIALVPVTRDGPSAAIRHLTLPPKAKSAKGNKGIEAIALLRSGPSKGRLLALLQEGFADDADIPGWLIAVGKKPASVRLKQFRGFAVTDATSLPGGDVIILERRFRFSEGVKFRIRRIRAADIKPGSLLVGDILFETDDTREIDNMEGIAAHRDNSGRTILTVISDDNFNPLFQRTLLMQFALPEK